MRLFDWPITKKVLKLWRLPHSKSINTTNIERCKAPIFTYIDFQEDNPAYGTKWGAIGNMSQNTLGTWWWTIKKSLHHPSPILPRSKTGSIGCMLQFLIGWARFRFRPMAEHQSDLWGHSHTHTHTHQESDNTISWHHQDRQD